MNIDLLKKTVKLLRDGDFLEKESRTDAKLYKLISLLSFAACELKIGDHLSRKIENIKNVYHRDHEDISDAESTIHIVIEVAEMYIQSFPNK